MRNETLTQARLKELLAYDPETGIFTWNVKRGKAGKGAVAGTPGTGKYIVIQIDMRFYRAHRLAWFYVYGEWPKPFLDHENRCRTDNWIKNLRIGTKSQNMANVAAKKTNKSGFKGVSLCKHTNRWQAFITVNRKSMRLGRFDTPEQAHEAYCSAAKEHFGEFARAA